MAALDKEQARLEHRERALAGELTEAQHNLPAYLTPTPKQLQMVESLHKRAQEELSREEWESLAEWASHDRGMRVLLLHFARARPRSEQQAFEMLERCMRWRVRHRIEDIFAHGYPLDLHLEVKRRVVNSFFFGHTTDGEPVYYNNLSMADLNHSDLVPGRVSMNDVTILWMQEMEYRERVLLPQRSAAAGRLMTNMVVVFDALGAGLTTLRLIKFLKATAALNDGYYPETVKRILVVNAPMIVNVLYTAVYPFLGEETHRKIHFVGNDGYDQLKEMIADDSLIPEEHGGSGPSKHSLLEEYTNALADHYSRNHPHYDPSGTGDNLPGQLKTAFQELSGVPDHESDEQ